MGFDRGNVFHQCSCQIANNRSDRRKMFGFLPVGRKRKSLSLEHLVKGNMWQGCITNNMLQETYGNSIKIYIFAYVIHAHYLVGLNHLNSCF